MCVNFQLMDLAGVTTTPTHTAIPITHAILPPVSTTAAAADILILISLTIPLILIH
jgi:hypothetical protein